MLPISWCWLDISWEHNSVHLEKRTTLEGGLYWSPPIPYWSPSPSPNPAILWFHPPPNLQVFRNPIHTSFMLPWNMPRGGAEVQWQTKLFVQFGRPQVQPWIFPVKRISGSRCQEKTLYLLEILGEPLSVKVNNAVLGGPMVLLCVRHL